MITGENRGRQEETFNSMFFSVLRKRTLQEASIYKIKENYPPCQLNIVRNSSTATQI